MTKLENMKNGQIPKKNFKKMLNLVISKPENHKLWLKITLKTKFEFNRKKEHTLIADNKLKNDQIKRKMEEKFNKPFTNQIF